jgi:hypothetical protein
MLAEDKGCQIIDYFSGHIARFSQVIIRGDQALALDK